MSERFDVIVVGAGAAGIFAALAARGALAADGSFSVPEDGPRVALLDGQDEPGRKILISGGGRCNVTNIRVSERDFTSNAPNVVRSALREFPTDAVQRFFHDRDVELVCEPMGKLFPVSGKARDVLDALHLALELAGVVRRFGHEVREVARDGDGWRVDGLVAARVIVATGGRSVPQTGSTGAGYRIARDAGHELVPTVPALAALLGAAREELAGVTLPAILTVAEPSGREIARAAGSLLFTHRGVSGPAALDVSGAFERALADGKEPRVLADIWSLADRAGAFKRYLDGTKAPGACLPDPPRAMLPEELEKTILDAASRAPKRQLGWRLAKRLPRSVIEALVPAAHTQLAQLTKEQRREAAVALTALDLGIVATEGYAKAEVTAGGVPLSELRRRTLESRVAPGLHFCGEVCDVTGRLGGFNFQWAWSSGFLAGRAAGEAATAATGD